MRIYTASVCRPIPARDPHRLVQVVFGRSPVRTGQQDQDRREGPSPAWVPAILVTKVPGGEDVSFGVAQFPTGVEKMAREAVQSESFLTLLYLPSFDNAADPICIKKSH